MAASVPSSASASPGVFDRAMIAARGSELEWLEADGRGGFASGTVAGVRTRRYHALLLAATTPPTGRFVLVNGVEAWVESHGAKLALSAQSYGDGIVYPDGADRIARFAIDPWPTWTFELPRVGELVQEVLVAPGTTATILSWRLAAPEPGVALAVRPLLSGRDYHALHHENAAFRFASEVAPGRVAWRPYDGVPAVAALHGGSFEPAPDWYRSFLYARERERALDDHEDLASPGVFLFDLSAGEAFLVLTVADVAAGDAPWLDSLARAPLAEAVARVRAAERARRAGDGGCLERAASAYLVRGARGRTIVAGYPWFTDWGRDTFIALRGLCLATGRVAEAIDIVLAWAGAVSQGMLPNRFPDRGEDPEYNAVDASLWYVVAVHEVIAHAERNGVWIASEDRRRLRDAVLAILEGYAAGTRYGIRCDDDGLIAAGEPGVQLTWMDAKVGDWVVTPRIGKPVEVQALWLNALATVADGDERWRRLRERALASFRERFWNDARGCLFDVVDADHVAGRNDPALRPNQIFAVGGLPHALLEGERARRVVDVVESTLATPIGLRSLAAGEPGYVAHYRGSPRERDGAYHQGTVWPWLLGPFVEAWLRVRSGAPEAVRAARERFLPPLLAHLDDAGIGHVSEIADAEPPHRPCGCPWQAWSVGEALRILALLAPSTAG
ncbi:MAG TPA: amylo-alpha-1,6-glucosidase [Candidatus Binatia bacterium]|nr:amylo-alpha-1,6-glucosidase [Candidatus Binatia bacterium]